MSERLIIDAARRPIGRRNGVLANVAERYGIASMRIRQGQANAAVIERS